MVGPNHSEVSLARDRGRSRICYHPDYGVHARPGGRYNGGFMQAIKVITHLTRGWTNRTSGSGPVRVDLV